MPCDRHARLSALHRGVLNLGPRFYSGLAASAGRPFLSQLLADGLLDRRAEPRSSRSRACEAWAAGAASRSAAERLRKTPLGERDRADFTTGSGRGNYFSRECEYSHRRSSQDQAVPICEAAILTPPYLPDLPERRPAANK